jgi:hypothetical protein
MVWIPREYFERFDNIFKGANKPGPKLLAGFGFGLFFACICVALKLESGPAPDFLRFSVACFVALPILFTLLVAIFLWADVVRGRKRNGERVGIFSQLFFGFGIWSLLIWIVLLAAGGFPLAIWIGSKTSGVPQPTVLHRVRAEFLPASTTRLPA